jgi:SAM-dependent methyltransferase
MYTDGAYIKKHPHWHVEDSPWKAAQVIKILHRNSISPRTVAEFGCGAGEVIRRISFAFPNARCKGFEISQDAFELTRGRETSNLTFHLTDGTERTERFDVILLLDVIEHVEDCFGFLRSMHRRAEYVVAHIPLDLSVLSLLIGTPMANRKSAGHLHYFTKETALALLSDSGYEVLDWCYPQGACFLPNKGWRTRLISPLRYVAAVIAPGLGSLLLGGASIMVLAR